MDATSLNRALAAIKNGTSIGAVSAYLRRRKVPHSANSWDQLVDQRIRPALGSGRLTDSDIRELLREAEDFGHQHVFFFDASKQHPDAAGIVKAEKIKRYIRKRGWEGLIDSVRVLGLPSGTEPVDIHFDGTYAAFKFVERRTIIVQTRQETANGYLVTRTPETVRAVSLLTVFDSGLLEIRTQSITGTPDYRAIANDIWGQVSDYFQGMHYGEMDLSRLRRRFVVNPSEAVRSIVRVRRAMGSDSDGTKFDVAMGDPHGDLLQSDAGVRGLSAMGGVASTRLGHTSVGFLPQVGGVPHRELGVFLLPGVNEIRVLPNCTRAEYEYIRGQIAKYS